MRDREFWEKWIRRNADELRPRIETIRDWYRAAGVEKGERRHFKAALKSVGETARRRTGRKDSRHRPARTEPGPARRAGGRRPGGGEGGPQIEGRLRLTREGRPVVVPDSPDVPAIRLPGSALAGALPKDRVVVRLERRKGGAPVYGRIVRIVERGIREFVGRYAPFGARPFVSYRDRDGEFRIPVGATVSPSPDPGDLVLAELSEYPGGGREGRAAIVRVLGKEHTMETIALAVTAARGIPSFFSEGTLREASRVPQAVRVPPGGPDSASGLARVDQRGLPFVTIDGEDARDFDDAVCLVRERGGRTRVLVAIADVSHYVSAGGFLDRDAYERGTSVYFPDRCIPMLPPHLSEGVCSLKPGVNRLTMTVDIPVNAQGRPEAASFYPSAIRSRARLTYDEVHACLCGREAREGGLSAEVGAMLREMEAFAGRLTLARADRGALDFDLPESRIDVEDDVPVRVTAAPRWEAHRLVEEFMLLANAAVAEFLSDRGFPFLFRIHDEPAGKRLEEFEDAAARLLRRSRVTDRRDAAGRLQAWTAAARGSKYERHVNMLLLRSMMLARYGPESKGHFGLALARYTHFTSPIRRYPDLIVHRVLKAALGDPRLGAYVRILAEKGEEVGEHLSARERTAMEAERDVEQRAKALFMSAKVGQTFPGVISSVTGFGFFVELEEFFVEGLVHVSTLRDDDYRFNAERGEWHGLVRKTRFGLGDRVRVRVRRTDADRGEIDLLFVEKLPEST